MKKRKDVTPSDYKKLQDENARLQSELKREKLWQMYRSAFGQEHSVGYNRFYDIIERHNLKVRKKRRRARTTDSSQDLPLYPNLVKELIPLRPNQLWVSDITYMVRIPQRGDGRLRLLLPVARHGLLHEGDHRLVRGRDAGGQVRRRGAGNGLAAPWRQAGRRPHPPL